MDSTTSPTADYALGDSAHELDRLIAQGCFIGDLTTHVLKLAGISRGLRADLAVRGANMDTRKHRMLQRILVDTPYPTKS